MQFYTSILKDRRIFEPFNSLASLEASDNAGSLVDKVHWMLVMWAEAEPTERYWLAKFWPKLSTAKKGELLTNFDFTYLLFISWNLFNDLFT